MDRFEDIDPGRDEFPLGPHPLVFLAVLGLVMVAAVITGGVFLEKVGATSSAAGPNLIEVADVVGLDEEEATAELESRGFVVEVESTPNVSVPAGEVIAQVPTSGNRVSPDKPVILTVSAGAAFVTVPDLHGSPSEEVELMLFAHGLSVGQTTEEESDLLAGEVVTQDPAGGEMVPAGTAVDLVLSTGPPIIAIPDIVGTEAIEAAEILEEAGFSVTFEERYSWRVRRGHAFGTKPEDYAPRGSLITVQISRGSAPTTTTAPTPPTSTDDDNGDAGDGGSGESDGGSGRDRGRGDGGGRGNDGRGGGRSGEGGASGSEVNEGPSADGS